MSAMEGQGVSNGLRFDKTINLGHILMIGTMVGAIVTAYATYRVTVNEYNHRLNYLEAHTKSQEVINNNLSSSLYNITRDVAVIKDRLERSTNK